MKTLIVALNSKYIHSSLAAWYLKESCRNECGEVKVLEFTINDSLDSILSGIYREQPQIAAFSCYIWNIEYVLKLVSCVKKVIKAVKIILGGPEVSYDAQAFMRGNPSVDYIISGEGENSFRLLLKHLYQSSPGLQEIPGLTFREVGKIISNRPEDLMEDLDSIPSPYSDEMLKAVGNRIIYFESSRGCPFSCSYCISSTTRGVRYFSMDRVREDLSKIMGSGARQVKFVDRTFNSNKKRAMEILNFILSNPGDKNFHFEAAADLFDDEMLDMLSRAPKGLIQFEIGIQTTNRRTLEAVNRLTRMDKVLENIKKLRAMDNIHVHVDLIAGLPGENYPSFKKSFEDAYGLRPHKLQLGFLKMLRGSKIRAEAQLYGYEYREYPPYEVLANQSMGFDKLLELKYVEELVERYYNSGRFSNTLDCLIRHYPGTAFEFYRSFALFGLKTGYFGRSVSGRDLYTVLLEFAESFTPEEVHRQINDLIKLDFLSSDNSSNLPAGVKRNNEPNFKERCFEFLKDEENIRFYLPDYVGIPPKQIFKKVRFQVFDHDVTRIHEDGTMDRSRSVVLFDYGRRDKVTGLYGYKKVDI
ncbi:MAG: B12-binding domain-containing radical SAM protein [Clostridiales bacterium]|jgi:radical SAM superfamily enzyme YgiQ (UPF0313 family)|nr:B12-binding domain-containing radical SAM protein [Eubacteriales bacterium]MDH7565816.1 B12-binding domain-containing radical SAM protein [Clostridiales bacterium]